MTPADAIKTEPLLFDKLLEPINALLQQLDQHPISQAAKKLTYAAFVRVLLFRIFDQIRSLRDLTLDLKTKPEARLLNLPIVGLSTLHDAFARCPVQWLIGLIQPANYPLAEIDQLKALGEIWAASFLAGGHSARLASPGRDFLAKLASGLVTQQDVRGGLYVDLRRRLEFLGESLPVGAGPSRSDLCDGSRLRQHCLLPRVECSGGHFACCASATTYSSGRCVNWWWIPIPVCSD